MESLALVIYIETNGPLVFKQIKKIKTLPFWLPYVQLWGRCTIPVMQKKKKINPKYEFNPAENICIKQEEINLGKWYVANVMIVL